MQLSDEPENLPSDRFWSKRGEVEEPKAEIEPVEEVVTGPEPEDTGRGPVGLMGAGPIGVLGAGLVIALALAVVFGVLWLRNAGTTPEDFGTFIDDSSGAVEETATSVATLMMNYDSTNIQQVGEQILELSTGDFAADYEETLMEGLGPALEEATASSRGQILSGPDVYFRSASEAIALIQIVQTTQSEENPGGQTFKYQVKITLVDLKDEGWKAARVEILSQERTS